MNGGHVSLVIIFTLLIISSKASINCLNFSSVWNNDTPWSERYIDEANNILWSNLILFFSIIRCVSRIPRVSYQRNISMKYITCSYLLRVLYQYSVSHQWSASIECFSSMEWFILKVSYQCSISRVYIFQHFISRELVILCNQTCLCFLKLS